MKTSSYRWTHSYGTPPPFFWDPKMGFWWETLGNHETRDFGTFCQNRKAANSFENKTGIADVWRSYLDETGIPRTRSSKSQGDELHIVEALPPSIKLNHFWYASCQLDGFLGMFRADRHGFLEKWRRLFVYERLSPGKPSQPGKGSHPDLKYHRIWGFPKIKVPQ